MRVRAKGNIECGGRSYGPGDVLEVTPEDARQLARAGAIEFGPVVDPQASSDEEQKPTE